MCELPTLYEERIIVARKAHRCCECRCEIAKGERYQSASGLWEGQFSRFSTCIACASIRDDLAKALPRLHYDELPAFGELREYLSEDLPATADLIAQIDGRAAQQHSTEHP